MISLIVARAKNGVIGRDGEIPWHLPADFAHFREFTRGGTVVMGGRTFQSIIERNGRPLPGRKNVVLTRDANFSYPDVDTIHEPADVRRYDDAVVIGAFDALLPYVDELSITEIDAEIEGDAHFPDLDSNVWDETAREYHPADADNKYDFDIVMYRRI